MCVCMWCKDERGEGFSFVFCLSKVAERRLNRSMRMDFGAVWWILVYGNDFCLIFYGRGSNFVLTEFRFTK